MLSKVYLLLRGSESGRLEGRTTLMLPRASTRSNALFAGAQPREVRKSGGGLSIGGNSGIDERDRLIDDGIPHAVLLADRLH